MPNRNKIFIKISKNDNIEFGLISILICSLLALYSGAGHMIWIILILTLATLIIPGIFYPFSVCWFGLSKILSEINSRIILCVIFILVVMPVGMIRKLFGIDTLKLNQFKKNRETVMKERNHLYNHTDINHSF